LNRAFQRPWAVVIGICVAVLVPFGYLVWPTVYRYDHIQVAGSDLPVRIDRFTGKAEYLYLNGWQAASEGPPSQGRSRVPTETLATIKTTFILQGGYKEVIPGGQQGDIEAEVQNGSNWTLESITVNVTTVDNTGHTTMKDRQYVFTRRDGTGAPNSSSTFGGTFLILGPGERWSATLVGATGTK
jgi:hypothetical protein